MKRRMNAVLSGLVCMLLVGCTGYGYGYRQYPQQQYPVQNQAYQQQQMLQQQLASEFRHPIIVVLNSDHANQSMVHTYGELEMVLRNGPSKVQTYILEEHYRSSYNQNLQRILASYGYTEVDAEMRDVKVSMPASKGKGKVKDTKRFYRQIFLKLHPQQIPQQQYQQRQVPQYQQPMQQQYPPQQRQMNPQNADAIRNMGYQLWNLFR